MKKTAAMFKRQLTNLWKDESGQGATEYILLLVVIVALALMFGKNIKGTLTSKLEELSGSIGSFSIGE